MYLTEEIREEMTMAGNNKNSENKTGDDSTETEKSDKTISKKISEPSSDKPNPKDMKITLPLSKSDKKSFSSMSQEDHRIPRKPSREKKPEPLVTAPEVTQDQDDMEKGDKVGSSIEVSKKTSVIVTPHLSLKTPT